MATRNLEWRGGTSTAWNTAANWYDLDAAADALVAPDSDDILTVNASPTNTTIDLSTTNGTCESIDFTGAGANLLTFSGDMALTVYGNVTLQSGMTWSNTGNFTMAGSANFDSNGVSITSMVIFAYNSTTLLDDLITSQDFYLRFGGDLVTNDKTITCKIFGDLGSTGAVTLTLGSSTINCTNVSFAAATLTVTANTATINVVPTGTVSLHLGGVSWGDATINVGASAKTVNLAAAVTHTGTFTHVNGVLDLKGYTITTKVYAGSANARTLQDTTGGGNIIVTGVTGTVFDVGTNLTVSNAPAVQIGTSNLTQTGDVTFAGGGKTFGNFTITKHAGDYSCIITGSNTFATFTCATPDATYQYSSVKFTAGTTTTVTSFVATGTASYLITITSATSATHTLSDSAGTNTAQYCTISYSIAEGGATWATANCTDGGNNTGWIFAAGLSIPIAMHHYKMMRAA